MKVAYVLKSFPKNSETFIHEEIYQLIKQGVEVKIFSLVNCSKEKKHKKVIEILKKAKLVNGYFNPFCSINNLIYAPELLLNIPELFFRVDIQRLLKDIKEFNPDIIHTHFIWERAELVSFLSNKLNKPFTVTCHAKDIYIPNKRRIKLIGIKAKKIITISNYNKKLLFKLGVPENNIEVIHCGVDLNDFTLAKDPNNSRIQLLSVGRFVEKKGFLYLLKATKLMTQKNINFELRIIGSGPLSKSLIKFVKNNNLSKNVLFLGQLIDKEVIKEIANCDYFVLPCVRDKTGDIDGIPVVLMEAMARGKTVISTRLTGIPELIDDKVNGYLIEPNNEKAIAELIGINVKKLNPKIVRDKIEKEFNSKLNVGKIVEVWSEK